MITLGEQQFVGQGSHARRFFGHSPHHAVKLTGAELAAGPVGIGDAADDAQRLAQLMACISDAAAHQPPWPQASLPAKPGSAVG